MTDYTYNTGSPVGSTDVRDGVDNLKSFDVLLNSTDASYQDRLGNTVPTASGAIKALGPVVTTWTFTTGGTLNYPNEAALNPADGNYYGWTGAFPKVVAPGTDPTLPGSGYVPRTDVVLRSELAWAVAEHHVSSSLSLTAILTMTTGPVTIYAPIGRWPGCDGSLWRDGITLIGEKMPTASTSGSKLEGGTVFTGTLNIYGKHLGSITDCGFDCGVDAVAAGAPVGDGLIITNTLQSEQTTSRPSLRGWHLNNVSGMVRASGDAFHGVLIENLDGELGCSIGNLTGYNGIASVVIKCKNLDAGDLVGHNGDPYTVVLKSNKYAELRKVGAKSVYSFGGGGAAIVSDDPTSVGSDASDVSIGLLHIKGGDLGFKMSTTAAQPTGGVSIGRMVIEGVNGVAAEFGDGAERVKIGSHDVRGCLNGISIQGSADVDIGDGSSNGNAAFGYIFGSYKVKGRRISASYNANGGYYAAVDGAKLTSYEGQDSSSSPKLPIFVDSSALLSGPTSTVGTVVLSSLRTTGSQVAVSCEIVLTSSVGAGVTIGSVTGKYKPLYSQILQVNYAKNDGLFVTEVKSGYIDTDGNLALQFSGAGIGDRITIFGTYFRL